MSYKILKIASFYRGFLDSVYSSTPGLESKEYDNQYRFLMNKKNAWSDFFKMNSEKIGIEVIEIIHNARFLQKAWIKEYANENIKDILTEQIKYYSPNILFFQDIKSFSGVYIKSLRAKFKNIKLIFGHSCSPFSSTDLLNYKQYDFILTCLPSFKEAFDKSGIKSYKFDHGFETSILDNIKQKEKSNDLIFIGSLQGSKDFHDERLIYIESLLKANIDLKLFTDLERDNLTTLKFKQIAYLSSKIFSNLKLGFLNQKINFLKKVSACTEMPRNTKYPKIVTKNVIKQSCFGLEMYDLLAQSNISLNIHGGIAGKYAANMRLFETTGVGTLLLTDHKQNIKDFFEPDYEIVTFKSPQECIEKAKWLIENPEKAKEIALAGQTRTLKDHSLENRFMEIHQLIKDHLK